MEKTIVNGRPAYVENGVTFYYYYREENIVDIDVEPGVKEVKFCSIPGSAFDFMYHLKDCMKQFPDVETIYIGPRVSTVIISNFMFPNVKHVTSRNQSFKSGPLLIRNNSLLNTFCKKENEVVDLSDVLIIDEFAFSGCISTNLINTDNVSLAFMDAFDGSALSLLPSRNGLVICNNLVIDVDKDEIALPPNAVVCQKLEDNDRHFKKVVIKNCEQMVNIAFHTDVLVLDDENMKASDIYRYVSKFALSNVKHIEISKRVEQNIGCKSIDGIIYSADGKRLIVCPGERRGHIEISEGTEEIEDNAFYNTDIESVSFPNSLRKIGCSAFGLCYELKKVDFGNGIEQIGDYQNTHIFNLCTALKSVDIPPQVKYIGTSAFNSSGLKSVILHEGLETIGFAAFNGCDISKITIPKSVKLIEARNLYALHEVIVKCHDMTVIESLIKYNCVHDYGERDVLNEFIKFEIDGIDKPIFLPKKLTKKNYQSAYNMVKKSMVSGTVENICESFYGASARVKQHMAIAMYTDIKNDELKGYLRRAGKSIIEWFVLDKDESSLIKFLEFDIMTANTLKKILPMVNNAGMIEAQAYILNLINKESKEKTFRI